MPVEIRGAQPFGLDRRSALAGGLGVLTAPSALWAAAAKTEFVYIGMNGDKIHAARFDPASGDLTGIGPVAEGLRPTWAVRHPSLPILYYNDEAGNDGKSEGGVITFRADPLSGALTRLGNVRTGGGGTTNLWFDAPSRTLLTANFAGSVSTLPIGPGSLPGAPSGVTRTSGAGPHPRQASSHPHAAVVDATGRFVLVPDLGADRVFVLPYDRRTGTVGPFDAASPHHYVAPAGSGPRHIVMDRTGRRAYLLCELTAEIHVLSWDAKEGRLQLMRAIPLSDLASTKARSGAELEISGDGRFLYVCNRGENALLVFALERRTVAPTLLQTIPTGGERPWHFAVHPSGRWLIVANRDSNALRVFGVDRRSGRLTDTGKSLASPGPVHVCFFQAN